MTYQDVFDCEVLLPVKNNGGGDFKVIEVGRGKKSKIRGPGHNPSVFDGVDIFFGFGHADVFDEVEGGGIVDVDYIIG